MTLRAITGLVVLNLGFAVVGGSLLWGLRGWRWWSDIFRLVGLAYFLGVAALIVVLSLETVLSVPFGPPSVLVSSVLIAGVGLCLGWIRRRPRPRLAPAGWSVSAPSLFAAVMAAGVVLWLEASFRAARLQPMWQIDAWGIWTSRAKALFYSGDLGGVAVLRNADPGELYYPPGLSLVQAQAFEAMGSADAVTLHLQHWFFALGFVAAVFGLLAHRVRAAILVPIVLLVLVTPTFADIAIWPLADPLLGYLVSVAAILVCLWLEDRAGWRLASAALLLGGAVLVKREAVLVVACVYAAAAVASWANKRAMWPALGAAGAATVAMSASYRVWLFLRGGSDAPSGGLASFTDRSGRGTETLQFVASSYVGEHWRLPVLLALAGVILAFVVRCRSTALFVSCFLLGSLATSSLVIWSAGFGLSQNLSVSPVLRLLLVAVLVVCPLTAILFEDVWRRVGAPVAVAMPGRTTARRVAAWAVLAISLLLYPASALFGVSGPTFPGGRPNFPEPPPSLTAPNRD